MTYYTEAQAAKLAKQLCEQQETLRDKFAMAALNGLIHSWFEYDGEVGIPVEKTFSVMAYEYADAMIEARKVK